MSDKVTPIAGISRKPYVEVTDYEKTQSDRWTKTLMYAGFTSIAFVGVRFAAGKITFQIDPNRFSYLSQGLNQPGVTPWYQVRGKTLSAEGKIAAGFGDFGLEALKRFEELGGGIGRTLGLFGMATRGVLQTKDSVLDISAEALEAGADHYHKLIGRKFTPEEAVFGMEIAPFSEADLERHVRERHARTGLVLTDDEIKKEVKELIDSGEASPGKIGGLFSRTGPGQRGSLITPDIGIGVKRWGIPAQNIEVNAATGQSAHQHVIRDTRGLSESLGARGISSSDPFPYIAYKAPKDFTLGKTSREIIETVGDPSKVEKFISDKLSPKTRAALQETGIFTKRMSERYLRMLDQPLEMIEEFTGKVDSLKKLKESKPYLAFKNIFGTGGNYSGSTLDLWARHAGKIVPLAIGAAAVYEAGSAITKLVSDRNLAQVGGEAVGAVQRMYAKVSDVTGLTSLNNFQEREAEGSHRLLGVLAFPAAGYLTGRVLASTVNPVVAEGTKTAWASAREQTSKLPSWLGFMEEKIPSLKAPMTRGKAFGITGAVIGAAMSVPFLLGSLGSQNSYDETVAEQRGETEVAVRKGANWEMGRSDLEGENVQYHRMGWYNRLMQAPADDLQFGDLADRPLTRMIKGITDPYFKEKEFYYDRPYAISGPDTSGAGPLGTIWGMTLGRVFKPPVTMHAEEASEGGVGGLQAGEAVQYGRDVSQAPEANLGGLGPSKTVSPYSASFLGGELAYKATESVGLPGFIFSSIKKRLTGSPDFADQEPVLESAADFGSMRDRFWDLGLGGGFSSTEGVRRFLPKERHQLQKVNPVENNLPSWLSGVDGFQDLKHGDGYSALAEGELRLPGSGYCLTPETRVLTEGRGYVPIAEIEEGEGVLTSEGFKEVLETHSREYEGPIIGVKAYKGLNQTTWLTPEHLVKAVRVRKCKYHKNVTKKRRPCKFSRFCLSTKCTDYLENSIQWVKASELEEGDFVLFPHTEFDAPETDVWFNFAEIAERHNITLNSLDNTYTTFRRTVHGNLKHITGPFVIQNNPETWFVFGLFAAEGSIDRSVKFALHEDETFLVDKILKFYPRARVYHSKKERSVTVHLCNKMMKAFFESEFGRVEEKRIPRGMSKWQFASFLSGLFQGDSTLSKECGVLTVAFTYQRMMSDLLYLLSKYAIGFTLKERLNRSCWELTINACSSSFLEMIGDKSVELSPKKTMMNLSMDGQLCCKIKKIVTKHYSGTVHDLTVEGISEFTTSFIVHNSKRFPELAGVDPEDYPAVHKYKILGDVAQFSDEFKDAEKKVSAMAQSGELSEQDMALYQGTKAEIAEKQRKVKFREEPKGIAGNYWSAITELGRRNPVEHLLPFSPVHKFAGPVSPIAEYKDAQVLSMRNPSWDTPIEDFIKPAGNNFLDLLGFDRIPDSVQEKRDITEYFDKLEYMKFKRLESNARGEGDGRAAFAYARKADYTMYGADPFSDIDTIKKVLPKEEVPFFNEFVAAESPQEKGEILELVPSYTRKFYTAQWQKQIYAGLAAKGVLSRDEQVAASFIESTRALEGESASRGTWNEYTSKVDSGDVRQNTFPDYIKAKRLESYFEEAPYGAPGNDWIGFSPAVSMDDVKLKVVESKGLDFHDFNLWEDDVAMARRKPYLDEAAGGVIDSVGVRDDIVRSMTSARINDLDVEIVPTSGNRTRISIDVKEDRKKDLDRELRRQGFRH